MKILPLPTHCKATLSLEFWSTTPITAEAVTFEALRPMASGNGGVLSEEHIKACCDWRGVKYSTIKKHLSKCEKNGWLKPVEGGWQWVAESTLHKSIGGSWGYLGKNPVSIDTDLLLSFLGKSKKVFKRWLVVNGHLSAISVCQRDAECGIKSIGRKIAAGEEIKRTEKETGEKVEATMDWVKERIAHYSSREFVFDGAGFSSDLAYANTGEWAGVRTRRKSKNSNLENTGNRVGEVKNALKPKRENARCLMTFKSPRGVAPSGEELFTISQGNLTTIYSPDKFDKNSLQFDTLDWKTGPTFKGRSMENMYRTEVWESNASLSQLKKRTGYGVSTINRYLKEEAMGDHFVIREHFLVVAKYDPALVNHINIYMDQSGNTLRGRYKARRMSANSLAKALARGAEVEFRNIHGSIESVKKSFKFTVLVFQRAYYLIKEVKAPCTSQNLTVSGEKVGISITSGVKTPLNGQGNFPLGPVSSC